MTFSCASDGQSLRVSTDEASAVDMGALGRTVVSDDHPLCGALRPRTKIATSIQLVDRDQLVIGLRILTEAGGQLHIFNWGDELLASAGLPAAVAADIAPL